MTKHALLLIVFILLSYSCSEKNEVYIGKGNKVYGGTLTFTSSEKVERFFPLSSYSLHEQRVLSNVYEPLFKVDQKNNLIPHLAKGSSISMDGKTINLFIRKGVKFHDNECFSGSSSEMSVDDVLFSLAFACSGHPLNQLGHILTGKIEGSLEFSRKTTKKIGNEIPKGLSKLNDSTIRIRLNQPYNNFIQLLSHPSIVVLSKAAFEYYGVKISENPIGTGPFVFEKYSNEKILLNRNQNYWKFDRYGNQLPFLQKIEVLQPISSDKEYQLFATNKTDLILDLNVEKLENTFGTLVDAQKGKNVLHRVIFQRGNKVNFIGFDCATLPFRDQRVRKAFLLSVDRERLFIDVLKGDGNIKAKGFIPETNYYEGKALKKVDFNPVQAKLYLLEAGYNLSNPFPQLMFYYSAIEGSLSDNYLKEVCKQISSNLGVSIIPKRVDYNERKLAIQSGKAKIFKAAWMADYPDPEAYLGVFYSGNKGKNNAVWNLNNFKSKDFDYWYERALLEKNQVEKHKFQLACDQLLVDEAAVIPLYNEDLFMVLNVRVRDFKLNPNGLLDLTSTYLKEVKVN